jgi:tetratricopeptide (TPR) repeat protein
MLMILAVVVQLAAADNPFAGAPQPDAARYQACLAQAAVNPVVARRAAELWLDNEGGAPAKHCLGAALAGLGQMEEAAAWVEDAAHDVAAGKSAAALGALRTPELIAELKAQAADYWLEARDYEIALARLEEAIALVSAASEKMVDYLILYARAAAGLQRYALAVDSLTQLIDRHPDHAEAHVLRATASRHLGHYEEAEVDLTRALTLSPDDKDALLERGIVRRLGGDTEGAKADWRRIVTLYPESDAAATAQRNLELIEGGD